MATRRLMSEERLLRLYRKSLTRRSQFLWAFGATFQGVWLGLFDRSTLARVDEGYFKGAREMVDGTPFTYVDEQYNLGGLFDWEQEAVRDHFPAAPARVVVTGAGGGREVVGLLRLGYDAVGFEPHPILRNAGDELLTAQGHPGRLLLSERDVLPEAAGACDAVMVGWGSYQLMPGRARRVGFLREVRAALPDGGVVLCSFNVQTSLSGYYRLIARVANAIRRLRRAEPVELGDSLIPQFAHYFTEREIRAEFQDGGFRTAAFAQFPYGWAIGIAQPRVTG